MLTERELQISPIVQESVLHNTKVRPVPPPRHTCCRPAFVLLTDLSETLHEPVQLLPPS